MLLARRGTAKEDIRGELSRRFGHDLSRTLDALRPAHVVDVSCQGSVPEALLAFLEARDTEEAIRLAISLGGDADTHAALRSRRGSGGRRARRAGPGVMAPPPPEDMREVVESFGVR